MGDFVLSFEITAYGEQADMINDFEHEFQGYVGGFGSGKTVAMLSKAILFASMTPGCVSVILEPTFSQLESIVFDKFEEMLNEYEIPFTSKKTPFPRYWLEFEEGIHEIRMYGAENYKRIVGFSCNAVHIDEAETIDYDVLKKAFHACIARMRDGEGFKFLAMYSTPDQKGFMHEIFEGKPLEGSVLYRGNTELNPFLKDDSYVRRIKSIYPKKLWPAYLHGIWSNVGVTRVFDDFDAEMNGSTRIVKDNDILHLGIDFNTNVMACTVFVIENGNPIAVDEFYGDRDTASLIVSIKKRYSKHKLFIYPDPSGTQEHSNAPSSNMTQLKIAFGNRRVIYHKKAPPVITRMNCVNALICTGDEVRRFKVNTKKCKKLTKALEEHPLKDGIPNKKYRYDDCSDSMGYFLFTKFEVRRPSVRIR